MLVLLDIHITHRMVANVVRWRSDTHEMSFHPISLKCFRKPLNILCIMQTTPTKMLPLYTIFPPGTLLFAFLIEVVAICMCKLIRQQFSCMWYLLQKLFCTENNYKCCSISTILRQVILSGIRMYVIYTFNIDSHRYMGE